MNGPEYCKKIIHECIVPAVFIRVHSRVFADKKCVHFFSSLFAVALCECYHCSMDTMESDALEMVVPRASFNLCFRYKVSGDQNKFNQDLRSELYKSGKTLVAYGYVGQDVALRLLLTHKDMNKKILQDFFHTVVETGNSLKENI